MSARDKASALWYILGAMVVLVIAFWPLAVIRPMWLGWVVQVVWLLGPVAAFAYWAYRVEKKPARKA